MSHQTSLTSGIRRIFQNRVITPLLNLLRMGASPRRLAWSLAVGVAIGINPLLGSTTLVCLGVAALFRLNLIASQLTNHLVYPLEMALFLVFIRMGQFLFRTGPLPLGRDALLHAVRLHPLDTTRLFWTWEWHALVAWLLVVTLLTPLLAAGLTPMLQRLLVRLHNEPIVEK